jgi:hypothetical protein
MATHATGLDLPRPFRAAAPLIALAAAAALFDVDPRLPWLVGALGAACFGVAAVVRATRARLELAAVRRTADRLIVYAPTRNDASELVLWRCRELTTVDARAALRRELERTLRQLDPARLPSASPLRRAPARRHEALLRTIAERIGDEHPISARGVLLARELLRSPASPLYAEDSEAQLGRTLSRIRGALEP